LGTHVLESPASRLLGSRSFPYRIPKRSLGTRGTADFTKAEPRQSSNSHFGVTR
jgi:hypothetical protein